MEVKSYNIVDIVFVADVVAVIVVVLIDALHVLDMRMKRVRENIIT